VRVVSGWSPQQIVRVCRNELDAAAICLPDGAVPPADLLADDLGAQPVVFVVARDMKIPKLVDLEYLSRLSWVINQDGCDRYSRSTSFGIFMTRATTKTTG